MTGAIFSIKALNNLLWHRRIAYVLIVKSKSGTLIQQLIYDKLKFAHRARKTRVSNENVCYIVKIRPNSFKPGGIMK